MGSLGRFTPKPSFEFSIEKGKVKKSVIYKNRSNCIAEKIPFKLNLGIVQVYLSSNILTFTL